MKRTTLHIGTTKTGSTSIQQFLVNNRNVLQSQGVLYPKALGKVTHNVIPVVTKGKLAPNEHQQLYKILSEEDYQNFITDRRNRLTKEIEEAQPEHVVISSEHMHSRCFTKAHFARLKEAIAPALEGRDQQIVVYLRPQIEHAISLYSTRLSHGLKQDIDSFVEEQMSGPKRRYYDFRKLIKIWQRAFPEATMTVRAFNAAKTLPEGVISDFMAITGLDIDEGKYPPRKNKSLNAWSAETLRMLNSLTPPLPAGESKKIKLWLRNNGQEGYLLPDSALSKRFQESFAEGNNWVTAKFLADIPGALEPNWDRLNAPAPRPDVSEDDLRKTIAQVHAEQTRASAVAKELASKKSSGVTAKRSDDQKPKERKPAPKKKGTAPKKKKTAPKKKRPGPKKTAANASATKTIHFLHIGKAAGSQIKYLANQINTEQTAWRIKKHPHRVNFKNLPTRHPYFFSIRQPLSRFTSGFYSRKRKGQPLLLVEWNMHEDRAFKTFEHANDLAEALFEDSPRGADAFSAINSMLHTAKGQMSWFFKSGFLFDSRPPLWVIRQEHFASDWDRFLDRLGLEQRLPSPKDETHTHRNDYSNIPPLSDLAQDNLRRWYCQDIEFYKRCEDWIASQPA